MATAFREARQLADQHREGEEPADIELLTDGGKVIGAAAYTLEGAKALIDAEYGEGEERR